MCLSGAGEAGKSRLACAASRAAPEWFGPRSLYIAIDPEAASLGSVLPADRDRQEVLVLDHRKDVFAQILDIYSYDWQKEGIFTCITDTMTVLAQTMLAQLTNSG